MIQTRETHVNITQYNSTPKRYIIINILKHLEKNYNNLINGSSQI